MHYSSHPPCAFRNRIAKYLGVLVGAALVATLGLPSAVQAQTTGLPMVSYFDAPDAFTVSAPHAPVGGSNDTQMTPTHWVLEVDGPISVADVAATVVDFDDSTTENNLMVQAKGNDGTWMFRVSSGDWVITDCDSGMSTGCDADKDDAVDLNELGSKNTGPWLSYMHGRPDAPDGFAYAMSGTTHLFSWENAIPMAPNKGVVSYWLRWTSGDPTLAATKWTPHGGKDNPITDGFYRLSPTQAKALKDGEMYTFELTALGTSSSTTKDFTSAAASVIVPVGMVATPTLPETAALLLALLLLGSGAYLIRRRQSSGLISA